MGFQVRIYRIHPYGIYTRTSLRQRSWFMIYSKSRYKSKILSKTLNVRVYLGLLGARMYGCIQSRNAALRPVFSEGVDE